MYDINQSHSSIIKLPFLYTIVMYKSILMFNWGRNWGLVWDLNPGPLAPQARIIRLDQIVCIS